MDELALTYRRDLGDQVADIDHAYDRPVEMRNGLAADERGVVRFAIAKNAAIDWRVRLASYKRAYIANNSSGGSGELTTRPVFSPTTTNQLACRPSTVRGSTESTIPGASFQLSPAVR